MQYHKEKGNATLFILVMLIEALINQALALDPKALLSLKKLQGQTLAFEFDPPPLKKTVYANVTSQGIQLTNSKAEPHATVSGPWKAYLILALTKNIRMATRKGLSFSGDMATLECAQQLFFSLNIEWEELLSQWTGDVIARELGNLTRRSKLFRKEMSYNGSQAVSQYLSEEAALVPTRSEMEYYMNEIDTLRADLERLEMRIEQLGLLETVGESQ